MTIGNCKAYTSWPPSRVSRLIKCNRNRGMGGYYKNGMCEMLVKKRDEKGKKQEKMKTRYYWFLEYT